MKQKIADLINIIFGFRKFLAWIAIFFLGIIFRLKNYIDGGQFVDLMKNTFLGFVAGNGVEHIMTTVKEYYNSKGQLTTVQTPPPPPGDDVVEADDPTPPAPPSAAPGGSHVA